MPPYKKLSKREVKMTTKSIATKNKLFQTYLRNRCEFNHSQFKRFRNKLKHIINVSKKHYYRKYFADNLKNMKDTWKGIKQLISNKENKLASPCRLVVNNSTITDAKSIAIIPLNS